MTREETVRNLLTELIDMIDNGSQRDLDRADEIGASIIKLLEQEPKIGHRLYDDFFGIYYCSECSNYLRDYDNYCPNCGAKMVESQESEVQK